jgi:hypothetical protein
VDAGADTELEEEATAVGVVRAHSILCPLLSSLGPGELLTQTPIPSCSFLLFCETQGFRGGYRGGGRGGRGRGRGGGGGGGGGGGYHPYY